MKTKNLIAMVFVLVLTAAIIAAGQDPRVGGRPPGGGGFPGGPGPDGIGFLARDLNLSDDQKAQIKKVTDSFHESTKALREQMRALHESEPDPFSSFDETAVRTTAEARAKIEVELSVAHAKMMSQIGAVLTTDQKAQLAARRPPMP